MPNHFTEEEVHAKLEQLRVDILMLQDEIPAMTRLIEEAKRAMAGDGDVTQAGTILETLARQYQTWSGRLQDRHVLLMNLEKWVVMNGAVTEPVILFKINWLALRRHLKKLKYHVIDFLSWPE